MKNHDIVNGLKIKAMAHLAKLDPREMEIILAIRFSGTMATVTLNRLLGIRRADMNRRVGPRLEEAGWLTHVDAVHRTRNGVWTKRWTLVEEKAETLRQLEQDAQDMVNNSMTNSFVKDLDWVTEEKESA